MLLTWSIFSLLLWEVQFHILSWLHTVSLVQVPSQRVNLSLYYPRGPEFPFCFHSRSPCRTTVSTQLIPLGIILYLVHYNVFPGSPAMTLLLTFILLTCYLLLTGVWSRRQTQTVSFTAPFNKKAEMISWWSKSLSQSFTRSKGMLF